jgi:hypothetical protein
MKKLDNAKRIGGLGLLIVMLITGTVFSIQRATALSPNAKAAPGMLDKNHSQQAQRQYASDIPNELTPPGEVTPVNTPAPEKTPIPTPEG